MAIVRIQVDLDEKRFGDLEQLMASCRFATKKDLFNNALTLFEWAVQNVRQGRKIASLNESEQTLRELEMPALRAVEPFQAASLQNPEFRRTRTP